MKIISKSSNDRGHHDILSRIFTVLSCSHVQAPVLMTGQPAGAEGSCTGVLQPRLAFVRTAISSTQGQEGILISGKDVATALRAPFISLLEVISQSGLARRAMANSPYHSSPVRPPRPSTVPRFLVTCR